ncbi:MAG: SUMF1/EgtB/PvdO family nonheme iron enzyme [Chitinivibrionales bacterium]|nr:SUMF1/EgtB/PvdO family nonheme iron enzyme [Chitinivibrionales bacterium]
MVAGAGASVLFAQSDNVARYIEDVKEASSLYRTPDALGYYSSTENIASLPQSSEHEKIKIARSLRACVALGDMGGAATEAIPVLIEKFPSAEHVIIDRRMHYAAGQGSFEDWLQTEVVSKKNTFLLSEYLLEYNSAVKCEKFVETTYQKDIVDKDERNGRVREAIVDMFVIIKFHAGYCALARITGKDFGSDQARWREWWESTGGVFVPQAASESRPSGSGATSAALDDVIVKGKYRMVLGTGDEFIGTVEGVDDTSLILETAEGSAYTFNKGLVVEHELIEKPQQEGDFAEIKEQQTLTYAMLLKRRPAGLPLEVKLQSGATFEGKLQSVAAGELQLDVDGSTIPISKEAIATITAVARKQNKEKPQPEKPKGPFDTLITRNPATDEYGRPLANLTYVGKIKSDNGYQVVIKTLDDEELTFTYEQIVRRISHREKQKFSDIERYGKPLFCPEGTILIDLPPGKPGRPFFKVCMDKYEYPNREGTLPKGNVSYAEARKLCEAQGKRLCTMEEWEWACSGKEEYTYPYGWNFQEKICNTEGSKHPEPSGNRHNCASKYGTYDMVGNIFEWVSGPGGDPVLMGGPLSKCQTRSPGVGGGAKSQIGFRCCKSN